jgi:hypothetical protein
MASGQPDPGQGGFEVVRICARADCRLAVEQPFAGPHLLGPGRYGIWWRDEAGVHRHDFEVRGPGACTVELRL